jgi:hypothetical protein
MYVHNPVQLAWEKLKKKLYQNKNSISNINVGILRGTVSQGVNETMLENSTTAAM